MSDTYNNQSQDLLRQYANETEALLKSYWDAHDSLVAFLQEEYKKKNPDAQMIYLRVRQCLEFAYKTLFAVKLLIEMARIRGKSEEAELLVPSAKYIQSRIDAVTPLFAQVTAMPELF